MTISTTDKSQMGTVTSEGVLAASTEYDYPTIASALADVPKYTYWTDDWAGRTTTASPPFYTFAIAEGTPNLSTVTAPDGTITESTYEKGAAYPSRRLVRLPMNIKVFKGGSNAASSLVRYICDEDGEATLTGCTGFLMYTEQQSAQRGNVYKVIAYSDASAPDQLSTSTGYDFNMGGALSSTDENNQVMALSYYPDSLRLDTVYRPDTGYTRYHYFDGLVSDPDTAHSHSYVAVATASGAGTVVWSYQFMDGRAALARSSTSHTAASGGQTTDVEYDQMGRTKRTSNPYYSTGSSAALPTVPQMWTSVEQYDGLERATQVRLPDPTPVQTAYDGKTTILTDQAGRQRRQVTDALGRVIRVDEPDAAGNLGTATAPAQPTSYEYDVLGNLTLVTQAGPGGVTQERKFKYDSLGHLTHERQVEVTATLDNDGVRVSSGGLWTGIYKYNRHGLIKDAYDAGGVHTSFEYDGLNRIHQISYSRESGMVRTPNITYTYDQLHTGYFNKGRLTEVCTDAVNVAGVQSVPQTVRAYDYDLMGRVKNHQQSISADTYTLSYAYNLLGQMTSETYPSGRVVSYEYDDGARLKKVANGSVSNYATAFAYKPHGGLEAMTLGNGAVQTVSYNERLQPEQIKLTVAGVEKQRFDYQYGVVNLTTGAVDAAKNTGQIARVEGFIDGVRQWQQRYQYDSIGRLDIGSEHKGTNPQQLSWSADYDYDRWRNRYQSGAQNQNIGYVSVTSSDINTQTNRLTNQTTYDDGGNVLVDGKFRAEQYRYDSNGRQVWSAELNSSLESRSVYDGLGQRVQIAENGTVRNMVYDISGKLIAEYGGQVVGTGGTHYVVADVQGSTRVVMNGSGRIEARHDYLPFGEEIASDTDLRTQARGYGAVDSTRQRYAGMERDFNGLDHTLWRKYESRAGRWTTPDPYSGSMSIGDPQSFNRYAYVRNDPVKLIDPSGPDAIC